MWATGSACSSRSKARSWRWPGRASARTSTPTSLSTSARVSQLLASGAFDEALADADRFLDDVGGRSVQPQQVPGPSTQSSTRPQSMLPKRAASGTVHRGFTLKLSPEVAQRFVAALNANRLSEAGEIAARSAQGSGSYDDGAGVGVWWSRDHTQSSTSRQRGQPLSSRGWPVRVHPNGTPMLASA